MREELKNFDWHIYGLTESDFDYTLRLVHDIIVDRINQLPEKVKGAVGYDENGNEIRGKEIEDEVMDDMGYYTWIDNFFVCHFGLWRLQGIFEGIIKQEFFPTKNLIGLKRKLDEIREQNYSIGNSDYEALLEWGQLRNALSHFPPEKYRPTGLGETDLKEYKELVTRVINDLKKQKLNNHESYGRV